MLQSKCFRLFVKLCWSETHVVSLGTHCQKARGTYHNFSWYCFWPLFTISLGNSWSIQGGKEITVHYYRIPGEVGLCDFQWVFWPFFQEVIRPKWIMRLHKSGQSKHSFCAWKLRLSWASLTLKFSRMQSSWLAAGHNTQKKSENNLQFLELQGLRKQLVKLSIVWPSWIHHSGSNSFQDKECSFSHSITKSG